MSFSKSIHIEEYATKAKEKFVETENRLSEIEEKFQTRMNGKTKGKIIASVFGTVCWLAIFAFVAIFLGDYVINDEITSLLFYVSICILFLLGIVLLIDEILNYSYYGKIFNYNGNILQLKNRIDIGKNSIHSNQEAYYKSQVNGWHFPLNIGSSIIEEASSIETTINGMESLKLKAINNIKNFLYFASVIAVTVTGCVALFPIAAEIMEGISDTSLDSDLLIVLSIVGLVIAGIIEVILSKLVWSKTNCAVNNISLFIIPLGPIIFLALVAIVTLLVMLVILVATIALYILGAVVVFGIAFAFSSGS